MSNYVNILGRLTKTPELTYTPSGVGILKFTIAVNRKFKDKQTQKYEADFINCISFNKTAEFIANNLDKGNRVQCSGRIQTGSYENQEGKKIFTTDVVVDEVNPIDWANDNIQQGGQTQQKTQHQQPQQQNYTRFDEDPFANSKGPIEISEDNLPFS